MKVKKGIKLLNEVVGDGPTVSIGEYHLMSIRLSLNKGEIVKEANKCFGHTFDQTILNQLSHSVEDTKVNNDGYFVFCVNINRENFQGGFLYSLEGMKVGGYREVIISPHLAYREEGIPGVIPKNAIIKAEIKIIR